MTISTTRGTELNIDEIITTGMHLCGVLDAGQEADPEDLALGRIFLSTKLNALLAEGVFARNVSFTEVLMVPTQTNPAIYPLDVSVVDIVGDGAYIDASETSTTDANAETVVKQIDREAWHRISSKAATSRPTLFYYDRNAVPSQVKVWPVPDEAGTIRFQTQVLTADTGVGADTVDLRPVWTEYLISEMAHKFSMTKSLPVETRSYFRKVAKEAKDYAKTFAHQHVNNYMQYASNRWRGR